MSGYTFITGATGGLGEEFCLQCAEKKENLFLTGRSEHKLLALKEKLLSKFPDIKIEFCPCMLTSEEDRAKLMEYADEKGIAVEKI